MPTSFTLFVACIRTELGDDEILYYVFKSYVNFNLLFLLNWVIVQLEQLGLYFPFTSFYVSLGVYHKLMFNVVSVWSIMPYSRRIDPWTQFSTRLQFASVESAFATKFHCPSYTFMIAIAIHRSALWLSHALASPIISQRRWPQAIDLNLALMPTIHFHSIFKPCTLVSLFQIHIKPLKYRFRSSGSFWSIKS